MTIFAPALVTDRIVQLVADADLVIADLTGSNSNVMYELAIRHILQKPVVQVCEEGQTLPFDISGLNTVFLNHEERERGRATLRQAVAATLEDPGVGPVYRALRFARLEREADAGVEFRIDNQTVAVQTFARPADARIRAPIGTTETPLGPHLMEVVLINGAGAIVGKSRIRIGVVGINGKGA